MKLLKTLSDCDWITDRIDKMPNGTVGCCLPPMFPFYAKIYHPIYEDLSVADRRLTWQEEDKAKAPGPEPETEIGRKVAEIVDQSTLVYGEALPGSRLRRIRWADLAERLGMRYGPTLSAASFTRQFPGSSWPRYLIGPDEGSLPASELEALIAVLHDHTDPARILFRFWLLATTEWKGDKVFEGCLDEVRLFPSEELGVCNTPTHWFPEDRRWLVCSDYDSTFSLVGGSEALIRQLLDHPVLECVPVSSDTRIDWNADLDSAPA